MGGRSCPLMCQKTTNTIRHFMANINYVVYNHVDDFMGLELPHKVWGAFTTLGNLLRDLGVHESQEKSVAPTMIIEFLGITFNLLWQLIILPESKRLEILGELHKWKKKTWANKKQFQQLAGKLQFAALCVQPGRVFIIRLYEEIVKMQDGHAGVVHQDVKQDLNWWEKFLKKFNGVAMMWLNEKSGVLAFATDASLKGIGGFYKGQYFKTNLQQMKIVGNHTVITHLEMLAVVTATKVWMESIVNTKVIVETDNMVIMEVINRKKLMTKFL